VCLLRVIVIAGFIRFCVSAFVTEVTVDNKIIRGFWLYCNIDFSESVQKLHCVYKSHFLVGSVTDRTALN
jgi:hypothetical protein